LRFVKILQHQYNLGGVESCHLLVEASELAEVREQLAPGDVVEQQVEKVVIRERGNKVGDKGVPRDVGKDLPLVSNMVDLLELDN